MQKAELAEIVRLHGMWLRGEEGCVRAILSRANLSGAILSRANLIDAILTRANLSGAYLTEAYLSGADLIDAILSRANLSGAILSRANLIDAILTRANLSDAILTRAILTRANLTDAILTRANLSGADLLGANLSGAWYDIRNVLALNIEEVSDELTLELMRWDATVCGTDAMTTWAKGGACPFSGNIQRPFLFTERKEFWQSGPPKLNLMELWQAVAREKEITI